MTAPVTPAPSPGPARNGRARARATAAIVLLAVALAGIAGGVALDRFVLPRGVWAAGPFGGPFAVGRERHRRGGDRFARLLRLTPEQRVRIDSLMARRSREIRAAHEVARPRLDSILRSTRREVDSILTPQQRTKLRELREQGKFGPRDPFERKRR